MNEALMHHSFHTMNLHRWESLHSILQIADLFRITKEEKYHDAFAFLWKDILAFDVHNTGGYSSGEGSCGNSYDMRAIELCCSITWQQMTVEYLKMTKESLAADELERTFYNALLGSQNPTGRWWVYSAPMCGKKLPVLDIVVYQGFHFDGCHEINCCSANAGRAIGLLSEWAVLSDRNVVYINFYGAGNYKTDSGVIFKQETDYPVDGKVKITILKGGAVTLKFRIPGWSICTKVKICGNEDVAIPGTYMSCERIWETGDTVELSFEMGPRCIYGDERIGERASIYYGPLLLAFDCEYNPDFPSERLLIDGEGDYQPMGWRSLFLEDVVFSEKEVFEMKPVEITEKYMRPWIKFSVADRKGEKIYLTDYVTAGMTNQFFTTWFDVK